MFPGLRVVPYQAAHRCARDQVTALSVSAFGEAFVPVSKDRQLLDQWGTGIDNLSAATDQFDQSTTTLTYDNASKARVTESLGMMTQYMKIYTVDMGNARQHLIEYVNNAETYIRPDDPNYWNDDYRQRAMQAKDQALPALAEGDAVLGNLTAQAQKLEQLQ